MKTIDFFAAECPVCHAEPGKPCQVPGSSGQTHIARLEAAFPARPRVQHEHGDGYEWEVSVKLVKDDFMYRPQKVRAWSLKGALEVALEQPLDDWLVKPGPEDDKLSAAV